MLIGLFESYIKIVVGLLSGQILRKKYQDYGFKREDPKNYDYKQELTITSNLE